MTTSVNTLQAPLPGWRVWGFPELNLLVFSTESFLLTSEGSVLDLEEKAGLEANWTDMMREAYDQVGHCSPSLPPP
jgi:hypothetical protein